MREFDDTEKRIIRKIKDFKERGVNLNFLSLLDDFFNDRGIEIKKSTNEAWIYFDVKKFGTYDRQLNAWMPKGEIIYEIAPTTDRIIRIIFLLDYLEKNGLIFLFDFARSNDDVISFPTIKTPPDPIRQIVSDKRVVDMLTSYFYKEIVISQSIITLVNNNFLTKEEIQHAENVNYANRSLETAEKSIRVSNKAIIYSILLGAIGIVFSVYSLILTHKQIEQPIEIVQDQIDDLKSTLKSLDNVKEIEQISRQLDSLTNELKSIKTTTKQISDKIKKKN